MGGEVREFQVLVDPARLAHHGLSLGEVAKAVAAANAASGGGFLERPNEEFLIRGRARVYTPEDLAESVVTVRGGAPVLVKHVATVRIGPAATAASTRPRPWWPPSRNSRTPTPSR